MEITMEGYRPYRKMAGTCRTRPRRERRITWNWTESEPLMDGRYQVKPLRQGLVESAAELWRSAYPELYGSPHEFLFDPGQVEKMVALKESWDEDAERKVYCMPVVEELSSARVVSATVLTKFERNLQVEYSFAATLPKYRMQDLTDELRKVTRMIASSSGAEYFTTFCETWHEITQNWCFQEDWKVAGIFPGNYVRWNGGNQEYRGCTVHFYKFAPEAEEYVTKPEEWRLASGLEKIWKALEEVNRRGV